MIGETRIEIYDLAYDTFSDMSFFTKHIPENAELVQVQAVPDFGMYAEPDTAYFNIEWELKE